MTHPTDHLRRYAEDIASSVSPARSRVAALHAISGTASAGRPSFVPRLAFSSLAGLLVLNVAAAGVADAAVPGDVLYPLDRAYEAITDAVGLGQERTTERVDEAWALMARDDLSGAIELMATEVPDDSVHDVAVQMQAAGPENGVSAEHVQNLLTNVGLLAEARGDHDSQAWEEAMAAIHLVGEQVSAAQSEDQSELPAPANEQGPPDHADPQGPPADPGQPGNQGEQSPGDKPAQGSPPDNAGDQGPPPDTGPPDTAGQQGRPDDSDRQDPPDRPGRQGGGGGNQSDQRNSGGRR